MRVLAVFWLITSTNRTDHLLQSIPFEGGTLTLTCSGYRDGHPWGGLVYFTPKGGMRYRLTLDPKYNFWDIQAGDVDGDRKPEICLCTWSKTRLIRKYARRYFVYGWDGHDVYPKWRGSRLSKPYFQARLVSLPGGPGMKLLSVEITPSGRRCLMAYRWNDFGFTGLAAGDEHDWITIERREDGKAIVSVKDTNGPGKRYAVQIANGRIVLKRT